MASQAAPAPSQSLAGVRAFDLGIEAGVLGGPAPTALASLGIAASLRSTRGPRLAWAGRLSFTLASRPELRTADGGAQFSWGAMRAELCPRAFAQGAVRLCAGPSVGLTHVEGLTGPSISRVATRWRLWSDAGAFFEVGGPLHGRSRFAVRAGALVPLTRDTVDLVLLPNTPRAVHRTPPVTFLAALGIGWDLSLRSISAPADNR
jgi:hypothetical protein